jgi:protein SCO1/2
VHFLSIIYAFVRVNVMRPGAVPARRFSKLVIVLVASSVLLAACGGSAQKLVGTDLQKQDAPDFTLTDQRGKALSLSDFQGKAVVLTFIYTHCPDVCPLTAEDLRAADSLLPEKTRDKVVMLAVTVDPERDSAEALQRFSEAHQLADNPRWYTLRADRAALEKVWTAYGIDARSMVASHDVPGGHEEGSAPSPIATARSVTHTDAIYVIDPKGRERVLMHSDLKPQDLADNLTALVN